MLLMLCDIAQPLPRPLSNVTAPIRTALELHETPVAFIYACPLARFISPPQRSEPGS